MAPQSGRLLRVAAWSAASAVLALVFLAYLNPHTMVDLSNRVWACFQ
jgi:hypothetical protein